MRRENDGDRKGSGRLDLVHAQRLIAFSLQTKHLSSYNISNPHSQDIGVDLLKRILRQAGIQRDEWDRA